MPTKGLRVPVGWLVSIGAVFHRCQRPRIEASFQLEFLGLLQIPVLERAPAARENRIVDEK